MAVSKSSSSSALNAMATVVITTFVVAVLYVGRDILIPLALAALLAFLLPRWWRNSNAGSGALRPRRTAISGLASGEMSS